MPFGPYRLDIQRIQDCDDDYACAAGGSLRFKFGNLASLQQTAFLDILAQTKALSDRRKLHPKEAKQKISDRESSCS